MNRRFLVLLALSCLLQTGLCQSERQVRKFVRQQLSQHPHLHLMDLYKSCYQDFMGSEHLVTNREVAEMYVQKELAEMADSVTTEARVEPCGLRGNYVRIPLELVKKGVIPADSLVSWFVQSASAEPPHTLDEWIAYWYEIERIIDKMNLNLPDYENDKITIQEIFKRGGYASVHSQEYKQHYHPHYRIVTRQILRRNRSFLRHSGAGI